MMIPENPVAVSEEETMRLQWLVELERWPRVIALLQRIQERTELTPEQRLMLALSHYGVGQNAVGRLLLERLIEEPDPSRRVVLEYARHEGLDPERGARAYAALERWIAASPNDSAAIAEISRLDVANDKVEVAITRLDSLLAQAEKPRPQLMLLRAQLHAASGNTDAALRDARTAIDQEPRLLGAAEVLAALLLANDQRREAFATLRAAEDAGTLGPAGYVQLGNLYRAMGFDEPAIDSLEKALAAGSREPRLKNDIAFLLAKNRQRLGDALQLAKDARRELDNDPNTTDTLGYVYLQSGSPEQALPLFQDAAARAVPPQPSFFYHLGIALESLGRREEAAHAFERALSISATFPEAPDARRALAGATSVDAS